MSARAYPSDQASAAASITKTDTRTHLFFFGQLPQMDAGIVLFFFRQLRQLRETPDPIFEAFQNLLAG